MRKVLLMIGNSEMYDLIHQDLTGVYELTRCTDYNEAVILLSHGYDGLILDPFLQGMDGLKFIEEQHDILPDVVLLVSWMISEYMLKAASQLGIGYLLSFPFMKNDIRNRVNDMFQKLTDSPVQEASPEHHLKRLGLRPHTKGYRYLMQAIPCYAQDPTQALSKHIYPEIVRQQNTSKEAIDNAIHREILDAWKLRDEAIWSEYFNNTERCPVNKQFIAIVAEKIKDSVFPG